jgi:hypothetical protein
MNMILKNIGKEEIKMTFKITNTTTNRSYQVIGNSFETVWNSEKCWVSKGTIVTIEDENENIKYFKKEN